MKKIVFPDRTEWRNENDKLHRTDGPAIECTNGYKEWHQNGQLHRLNGPAVEWPRGNKRWYFNGKLNRFLSEDELITKLKNANLKSFILKNLSNLDEGEIFLLRLTIENNFPEYLSFLDKLLILK